MMATAIYIFGGMLMNLKSISAFNEKLKFIEKNLRQNYHNVGAFEDIENVSTILCKIQKLAINLNDFYGMLISLTFIGSTFLILSSVELMKQ